MSYRANVADNEKCKANVCTEQWEIPKLTYILKNSLKKQTKTRFIKKEASGVNNKIQILGQYVLGTWLK